MFDIGVVFIIIGSALIGAGASVNEYWKPILIASGCCLVAMTIYFG